MAKSKESFNKKEKQKLKQKKRKEKAEKKEERKATSTRGKSFDDMIAYVDEHGRISDTPPDLANKKKIKSEDIQISIPKQKKMEPDNNVRKGTITFFNDSKGYGFIKDHVTQESIFVHLSGLIDEVRENDVVTFKVEKGPKGLAATEVKK
jgi:cold shock CspA family protein